MRLEPTIRRVILSLGLLGMATAHGVAGAARPGPKTDIYGSCTVYSTTDAEEGGITMTFRGPVPLAKSRCAALVMDGSYQAQNPAGSEYNYEFDTQACRVHYARGAGWEYWHGHYVIETVTVHYYSYASSKMAQTVCGGLTHHKSGY